MRLRGFFTDHPTSVGESYGEHFVFAIRFARATAGASLAAAVHAVFPRLFQTTASSKIRELHSLMESAPRAHATEELADKQNSPSR